MPTKRKTLTVTKTKNKRHWVITVSSADRALRDRLQDALTIIALEEHAIIQNGASPWDEAKVKPTLASGCHRSHPHEGECPGNGADPDPVLPNVAVGRER